MPIVRAANSTATNGTNAAPRMKEEKELLEWFAQIYTFQPVTTFREVFLDAIQFMVQRIREVIVFIVLKQTGNGRSRRPPLKAKNSKRTSKCQIFFSTVPEKPKGGLNWHAKRGTFIYYPLCCKISKKLKGDPLETFKNFRKKKRKMRILNSLTVSKKFERGDHLFSSSIVCYAKKGTTYSSVPIWPL